MKYGICLQSMVPVRKQPGGQHEMTNQLLFGDLLLIKDEMKQWLLVETVDDAYNGWVDQRQVKEIDNEVFDSLTNNERHYSLESCNKLVSTDKKSFYWATLGSCLPYFKDGKINFDLIEYNFNGKTKSIHDGNNSKTLVSLAKMYLGAPYLWGGRSLFGIDCSGFVQIVFKMCGIMLPRDSAEQVDFGNTVSFIDDAQPGDLAFFDNEENKIVHVGILLGKNQIIHASGEVRIGQIDHFGIYSAEEKKYTHNLRIIKRIVEF